MAIILIILFGVIVFGAGVTTGKSIARSTMLQTINQEAYSKLSYQDMETFKKLFKQLKF